MSRVTVTVVIPALNEELNLRHVLPSIPRDVHEVILVDGSSTDRTVEVARELIPNIRVIQQEGTGKGAALRSGFAAATGDIIVTLDADGSTDPAEIPRFVHALLAGADFAKGSRFLHGAGTSDMPLHRRMGNAAFVYMVRLLHGGRYSDLCYGYNAFWRRHLPLLELDGDGFEIETEMNIRALRSGLRVHEVPSFEDRRVMGVGRLRTFPDGWRVLRTILRERRRSISEHDPLADMRRISATGQAVAMVPVPVNGDGVPENWGTGGDGGSGGLGDDYQQWRAEPSAMIAETNGRVAYLVDAALPDGLNAPGHNGTTARLTDGYVARLHALLESVDRRAIDRIADALRAARERGSTAYFAGNGGSSATAAHWVNDLAKSTKRPGLPPMRVMNLTDNVPWFTALANDEGYERVFAGQLENFARPGDVLVIVSASGNSPNILRAIEAAKAFEMLTLGLVGFDGGAALQELDAAVWIPTEHGAYGLVETAHAAIADIVTAQLTNDHALAAVT
jgi:phosphoheptose isomerase